MAGALGITGAGPWRIYLVTVANTASMGINDLAGQISCKWDKEGRASSTRGAAAKHTFSRTVGDTLVWFPFKPISRKAFAQDLPRSTSSITSQRIVTREAMGTTPFSLVTAALCVASDKCRLKRAKTWVSQGCRAQVILAGIKK